MQIPKAKCSLFDLSAQFPKKDAAYSTYPLPQNDESLTPAEASGTPATIAATAGIRTKIGNHTFRATGITAYLKNSGKLEVT